MCKHKKCGEIVDYSYLEQGIVLRWHDVVDGRAGAAEEAARERLDVALRALVIRRAELYRKARSSI